MNLFEGRLQRRPKEDPPKCFVPFPGPIVGGPPAFLELDPTHVEDEL